MNCEPKKIVKKDIIRLFENYADDIFRFIKTLLIYISFMGLGASIYMYINKPIFICNVELRNLPETGITQQIEI